jgi:error-prone DNA polymerase
MVLVRQRPQTASGVVFMTLEDEFGFFNLVLWAATYERLRHVATSYPLVLVRARVEIADRETASAAPIIHLVVHAMEPLETEGIVATPSRDFH